MSFHSIEVMRVELLELCASQDIQHGVDEARSVLIEARQDLEKADLPTRIRNRITNEVLKLQRIIDLSESNPRREGCSERQGRQGAVEGREAAAYCASCVRRGAQEKGGGKGGKANCNGVDGRQLKSKYRVNDCALLLRFHT